MNHLTTLYVNQADRESQIAEDLRTRQILQVDRQPMADTTRQAATTTTKAATPTSRPAALHVRATGR